MTYDAILFDHDGVITTPPLIDLLQTAARDAFVEAGVESPPDRHVEGLAIGVTVDWFEEVCAEHGLDPDEFWTVRDRVASTAQQAALRNGEKTLYDDVTALADLAHDFGISVRTSTRLSSSSWSTSTSPTASRRTTGESRPSRASVGRNRIRTTSNERCPT